MRKPYDKRWMDVDSDEAFIPSLRCAVSELTLVLISDAATIFSQQVGEVVTPLQPAPHAPTSDIAIILAVAASN